jgi:hypothetical protein
VAICQVVAPEIGRLVHLQELNLESNLLETFPQEAGAWQRRVCALGGRPRSCVSTCELGAHQRLPGLTRVI